MSLVHQALKKLESTKQGYGVPAPSSRAATVRTPKRLNPYLISGIVVLAAVAFALTRYLPRKDTQNDNIAALRSVSQTENSSPQKTESRRTESAAPATGLEDYRAGRFIEAVSGFNEAAKAEPENPVHFNNLGLSYVAIVRVAEAEQAFKTALRLRPVYPEALNNYSTLLDARGETGEAISLLEAAIKARPGYADAHLTIAIAFERIGMYGKALAHYEKFLLIDAQQEQARQSTDTPGPEAIKKRMRRLRSRMMQGRGLVSLQRP